MVATAQYEWLSEQYLASEARKLQALRDELDVMRAEHLQAQRKQAADSRVARERRIDSMLAEWLPLPEAVVAPPAPTIERTPRRDSSPSSLGPDASISGSIPGSGAASPRPPGSTRATPCRPPSAPAPTKPPPPKLAPAAAALAAGMIPSPYNRHSRLLASAAHANAAAKARKK